MILSVKPTNQTTLSPSEKFGFRTINLMLVALFLYGALTLLFWGHGFGIYYTNAVGVVLTIQLVVDFIKYRLAGSPLDNSSEKE